MRNPLRRQRKPIFVFGGLAAVVALAGAALFAWWNTNVFGAEALCNGMVASEDVQSAHNSRGRMAEVNNQMAAASSEFRCTVKRTSRFIGTDDLEVVVRTATESRAFPFTTATWKNPSAMSYFKDGASGAVSDKRGWVILPKACWSQVGSIQGSRRIPPSPNAVAVVEAVVEQGSADREGLARLLVHAAQKVAAGAGCSATELKAPSDLSALSKPRRTDNQNACGLRGFSLPKNSLVKGLVEPGQEQLTDKLSHTWACDMYLNGTSGAQVSFSASSDANIVDGVLRDSDSFQNLGGNRGVARADEAVLHCDGGDVYFSARWNTEYDGVLLGLAEYKPDAYVEIQKTTFQKFLDSAADSRSCPHVTLPSR
ncbi:hypothetical protein [Streptomyces sp. SID2888]|uniref:hypothetical protein n=1 Tax=Streptomyces sp. SID2888 TaxID=2690256 RepID=UPI00136FC9FE|nr:hypothetical protein [Streptomyces sp. SID2888]MYV50639.1 hypothetical protein [Streptomyces sp. SID2888]